MQKSYEVCIPNSTIQMLNGFGIEKEIMLCLGGPIAQVLFNPRSFPKYQLAAIGIELRSDRSFVAVPNDAGRVC
jgi:hypothetical protein